MNFSIWGGPPKRELVKGAEVRFDLMLGVKLRLDLIPDRFYLTVQIQDVELREHDAHQLRVLPVGKHAIPELRLAGGYVSQRSHPRGHLSTDGANDRLVPVSWLGLPGLLWYASDHYGWETAGDILELTDLEICQLITEKYTDPSMAMSSRVAQAAANVDDLRWILENVGFDTGWKHARSDLMHAYS